MKLSTFLVQAAGDFWRLTAMQRLLLAILGAVALVSVGQGFSNGHKNSQDFQWSPATLFVEGYNPYQYYLNGNRDKRIILSQAPVYAHGLYVILAPIAMLNWDHAKSLWALFNISASIFTAVFIGCKLGLRGFKFWTVLLVFLASTPFRNGVGNGQQNTITLLAFCALLTPKTLASSFWAGFGYVKYSFAPPLAIYLFLKRGSKHLAISLVPGVLGYLVFLAQVGGDPITVLLQPLKVYGILPSGYGTGDVMSLETLFPEKTGSAFGVLYYAVPLALGVGLTVLIARFIRDDRLGFALLCTTELICFKHLGYDFVFLLPAFAYAVANMHGGAAKIVIWAIVFYWFGLKLIDQFADLRAILEKNEMLIWINLFIGVATLISLFSMNRGTRLSATRSPAENGISV